MQLVFTIVALLLGVLGAASILKKQIPAVKPFIAMIAPFAGLVGVVGFVLGVYWLVAMAGHLKLLYVIMLVCITLLGLIFSLDIWTKIIPVEGVNNFLTAAAKATDPFRGIMGVVVLVLMIMWLLKL